jgi:hypothetical protein
MSAWLEKLKAAKKRVQLYPQTWVEFDEDGLVLKTERWPFPPLEQWVYWEEVTEIDAALQDWWHCHRLGLLFCGPWKRPVAVYADQKGWDPLVAEVEKRYAGFNKHNFSEVWQFFPGEMHLPCWNRTEPVGDLKVNLAEKRIVRANDGSVFFQWE